MLEVEREVGVVWGAALQQGERSGGRGVRRLSRLERVERWWWERLEEVGEARV